MKADTITGVNALPLEDGEQKKGKADKKAGKRIGYNYIVIKSFKESQKNDVVKCLYIKSLTKWGFCVIKEGTYGDTKDKHGRDVIDRLKWQEKLHKYLQKQLRIPKWLNSFEENGNFYLVIELINGKSLTSTVRKYEKTLRDGLLYGGKIGIRFIGYILQITELLEKLHQRGIVHRDATGGNFMITKNGKVALIDMELSYCVKDQFPFPQFDLGTFGYMSPQQEASQLPTFEEDIFSLGAIILQVFTTMSPSKLTQMPYEVLEKRVRFFIPDENIATIVLACLHPEPEKRPEPASLKSTFIQYKKDLLTNRPRALNAANSFSTSSILEIIQGGLNTFSTPLLADPEKGWFAENTKLPSTEKSKINKAWYGSFYNGVAGIIYNMVQAKQVGLDISSCQQYIDKGFDLIEAKYITNSISSHPGMYFGAAGIAVTMQEAMQYGLLPYSHENVLRVNNFLLKENSHVDHLNGVSGHGLAVLYCNPVLAANGYLVKTDSYVKKLLEIQQPDGSWLRKKKDKMMIQLSFAYGMSGILHFLLTDYKTSKDPVVLEACIKGLQFLMSQAISYRGALFYSKESIEHYTWWCAGEAGIAQAFIKAYEVIGDPSYKIYAQGILRAFSDEITHSNLSQCHGLSGLGEIYLEAFRIFKDDSFLRRSEWIANLILHCRKVNAKYGTWWQVEHERQPTGGFMLGNSGLLHYLLRFCYPDQLSIPLQPTGLYAWNTSGEYEQGITLNQAVL